jgi:glycine cleavage system H protein
MPKAKLRASPPKEQHADRVKTSRWFSGSMSGGVILTTLVSFAVAVCGLVYLILAENNDSFATDNDFSEPKLIIWCTIGGLAALAFGLVCLRRGLFRTLATIVSSCCFVFVVGFSLLVELKAQGDGTSLAPRAIAFWQPFVFLLVCGSVAWCLQNARQGSPADGRPARRIGVTAIVSTGLMLSAAAVWAFGFRASKSQQHVETQDTSQIALPQRQEPTWENIRRIIADRLNVPQQQVVPTARFDEDLNAAEPDMEDLVEGFQDAFGVDLKTDDPDMLVTVQDAIDYVNSPEIFRTEHAGRTRYSNVRDPYPTDVMYSKVGQWIKTEGNIASVGLTYHTQQSYAFVGTVSLPQVGSRIIAGEIYATMEVGMAGTVLIAPVSGIVTEVNQELATSGKSINKDPYAAWFIKVELTDPSELKTLLSAQEYAKLVDAGN